MSTESPQPPSDEASRFKDAMRRILSLTPEQREEVKRKVAEEAEAKTTGKNGEARMDETWEPIVVEIQPVTVDALGRVTFVGTPIKDLDAIAEFMARDLDKMPHNGYTPAGYAIYRDKGDGQFYAAQEIMMA